MLLLRPAYAAFLDGTHVWSPAPCKIFWTCRTSSFTTLVLHQTPTRDPVRPLCCFVMGIVRHLTPCQPRGDATSRYFPCMRHHTCCHRPQDAGLPQHASDDDQMHQLRFATRRLLLLTGTAYAASCVNTLGSQATTLRSLESNTAAVLTVANNTPTTLKLYWVRVHGTA